MSIDQHGRNGVSRSGESSVLGGLEPPQRHGGGDGYGLRMAPTITAPFTDVGALKGYVAGKVYSTDQNEAFEHLLAFYGAASVEDLLAIPARTNSGELGSLGTCWPAMFPFVDMATQRVETDDVLVSDDGYTMVFWGRWNGDCIAPATMPSGQSIDLAGKSFRNLRYAYRLTFSPETKKAILFEALVDVAEWGRLMDSPDYAAASAAAPIYPA